MTKLQLQIREHAVKLVLINTRSDVSVDQRRVHSWRELHMVSIYTTEVLSHVIIPIAFRLHCHRQGTFGAARIRPNPNVFWKLHFRMTILALSIYWYRSNHCSHYHTLICKPYDRYYLIKSNSNTPAAHTWKWKKHNPTIQLKKIFFPRLIYKPIHHRWNICHNVAVSLKYPRSCWIALDDSRYLKRFNMDQLSCHSHTG